MKTLVTGLFLGAACALPLHANDYEPSMRDYLESEVLMWAFDPALLSAIRAQNAAHAGLGQADIDRMDKDWRAQVGTGTQPLVDKVLGMPASDFLRARKDASDGIITEIFVMDNHGLNVAATDATSDYWQGDEAKFSETYGKGPGATHVGQVEFDDSSQMHQGQISLSVTDPASKELLGAITVGLNAEMLY